MFKRFLHAMFRIWCHGIDQSYYGMERYEAICREQGIDSNLWVPVQIIDRSKVSRR